MEVNHFQILLVLLVVAYKAWEFLRNATRKKTDQATNVPVPADLEQMPWEDPPETEPTASEHSAPENQRPREGFSPRQAEPAQFLPTPGVQAPPPRSGALKPSKAATAWAPPKAQPHPRLREWMIGQVILGKPLALSPRRGGSAVRR